VGEPTKVVAFYLPQFHPVAENDAWWGSGFTEWTNVVRARPLFDGHEQPHLPGALGFYDLRVPEVREQQAAMAARHGIDGFMYYHYWFGGRRVLDRVFREVLESGRPELPFCLCWANENWTRIWDGSEDAVLLEQIHDDDEQAAHVAELVEAFADPRYLKVHGDRPLFAVYRVQSLPDARQFIAELREACAAAGLADPYIVKFDTRGHEDDPALEGCDAAAQFPPHGTGDFPRVDSGSLPGGSSGDVVLEYDDVVAGFLGQPAPAWTRHETVVPGWDNAARRGGDGATIVRGSTPEAYERWLREVLDRAPGRGGLVFVNAWNEWAEGAHLEPDERWGDAYLRATARAVLGHEPDGPTTSDHELPPAPGAIPAPASTEALYLDVYDRYVHAQRRLTSVEATIRREVGRRTAQLEAEVAEERARADALAAQLVAVLDRLRDRPRPDRPDDPARVAAP
jgi:Glycosyltransferase WbsX